MSVYDIGDRVLDNWIIREKLGEGSFGRVYRIEREEFGQVYEAALKIITVPANPSERAAAEREGMTASETEKYLYSLVEDLVREIALMAKLKGTSHVVAYEDHRVIPHEGEIGWDILIRMEKLTPLPAYRLAHGMMEEDVARMGMHICEALELCRRNQIVHRDIKPENIFVSDNGDYKLGDFGIARTLEKAGGELSRKGTYNYMAPEIYHGEKYGYDVDLYSLGLVMYRLLNQNRLPLCPLPPAELTYSIYEEALARRMQGEPLPRPCFAPGWLGDIILRAAAFRPADRYADASEMRRDLEAVLDGREPGEATVSLYSGGTVHNQPVETQPGQTHSSQPYAVPEEKSDSVTLENVQIAAQAPVKKNKKPLIAALIAAAVLVIGILAAIFLLGGGEESENTAGSAQSSEDQTRQEALQRGMEYLANQQYEEAVQEFSTAIRLEPQAADGYVARADAYYAWGSSMLDTEESGEEAQAPDTLSPQAAEKFTAAADDYEKADDLEPGSADKDESAITYTILYDYYKNEGDEEKAEHYQEKAEQSLDKSGVSDEVKDLIRQNLEGPASGKEQAENAETMFVKTSSTYQLFQRGYATRTEYTYDTQGRLILEQVYQVYDEGASAMLNQTISYMLDNNGNVIEEECQYEDITQYKYTNTYDASGKLTAARHVLYTPSEMLVEIEYQYNNQGLLTKEIYYTELYGIYNWIDYEYDAQGRVTTQRFWTAGEDWDFVNIDNSTGGELQGWNEYRYDMKGFLLTCAHYNAEMALDTEENYDEHGNLTSSLQYAQDGAISITTYENEYDGNGNLIMQSSYENGEILIGRTTNVFEEISIR